MIADRNLYLTADRERVVEEDDPAAAFMFYSKGKEIPDAEAERYGLDAPAPEPEPEPEAPAAKQKAVESENKKAAAPANKARKTAKKK
jgi:hypothetical protein